MVPLRPSPTTLPRPPTVLWKGALVRQGTWGKVDGHEVQVCRIRRQRSMNIGMRADETLSQAKNLWPETICWSRKDGRKKGLPAFPAVFVTPPTPFPTVSAAPPRKPFLKRQVSDVNIPR